MKNQLFSKLSLFLIVLLGVIALYVNFAYFPLDKAIQRINEETYQTNKQKEQYDVYVINSKELDNQIATGQAEADTLQREISMASPDKIADDLSTLMARTGTSILSIQIGTATPLTTKSSDGSKVLFSIPVTLVLSPGVQNNLNLIKSIENYSSGAYSVDVVSYTGSTQSFNITLSMKYFAVDNTPSTAAATPNAS